MLLTNKTNNEHGNEKFTKELQQQLDQTVENTNLKSYDFFEKYLVIGRRFNGKNIKHFSEPSSYVK